MPSFKPSRDIWLVVALLSILCAVFRHFGGSALAYTALYAILALVGVGIAISLFLEKLRHGRAHGNLFVATLAPLFLLFIDLSSGWRIACLLVIALVAMVEWQSRRAGRNVS
ncbi:hypothetical protein [Sphingobium sp. EM0848]|uniref:hypothetical protein n=1 Tax=Sphingobium sp. EM0848 TaxID=2743473 RepID=UPI00159C6562|nr:hypothetical protein [Sphingobium sp. EM0848]